MPQREQHQSELWKLPQASPDGAAPSPAPQASPRPNDADWGEGISDRHTEPDHLSTWAQFPDYKTCCKWMRTVIQVCWKALWDRSPVRSTHRLLCQFCYPRSWLLLKPDNLTVYKLTITLRNTRSQTLFHRLDEFSPIFWLMKGSIVCVLCRRRLTQSSDQEEIKCVLSIQNPFSKFVLCAQVSSYLHVKEYLLAYLAPYSYPFYRS